MKTGSILGITLILLAIVSVMQGAVVIYITSIIQAAMSLPMIGATMGFISPYLTFMMIFGALQVLLGIAAFVSGILLLTGKGLK